MSSFVEAAWGRARASCKTAYKHGCWDSWVLRLALERECSARGEARSGWWSAARFFFLGGFLLSASPAEVRLAETTLSTVRGGRRHRRGPKKPNISTLRRLDILTLL